MVKKLDVAGQYMIGQTGEGVAKVVKVDEEGKLIVGGGSSGDNPIRVITEPVNPSSAISTIANASSLSGLIDLAGKTLLGIHMSAVWTTANLTFQVSEDGVTYDNLYDRFGNEVVYTVAGARYIPLLPSEWIGIRFVKVRSGTSAIPVAQGAARNIVLISKVV